MLPIQQSDNRVLNQVQSSWASMLNPVLKNKIINGNVLENVSLLVGTNNVNHLLGKKLSGWMIIRKRGLADIYDVQDSNNMPQLTLSLVSSAAVTVDIYVF